MSDIFGQNIKEAINILSTKRDDECSKKEHLGCIKCATVSQTLN